MLTWTLGTANPGEPVSWRGNHPRMLRSIVSVTIESRPKHALMGSFNIGQSSDAAKPVKIPRYGAFDCSCIRALRTDQHWNSLTYAHLFWRLSCTWLRCVLWDQVNSPSSVPTSVNRWNRRNRPFRRKHKISQALTAATGSVLRVPPKQEPKLVSRFFSVFERVPVTSSRDLKRARSTYIFKIVTCRYIHVSFAYINVMLCWKIRG